MSTEQKTPFAEAWESFRQDIANVGIFDARTITQHGPYLENRLHTAFCAAWNAGTAHSADEIERLRNILRGIASCGNPACDCCRDNLMEFGQ